MNLADRLLEMETKMGPGAALPEGEVWLPGAWWLELVTMARAERPKPFDLGLVPCSASKLDHAAPARELYTGDLFRHALKLAERECTHVLILSAEHHVVEPEQVLEPYDCAMPTTKQMRGLWQNIASRAVARTLREMALGRAAKVLNLAGQSYALSWGAHLYLRTPELTEPLKGLSIGEQRKKLRDLLTGAVSL